MEVVDITSFFYTDWLFQNMAVKVCCARERKVYDENTANVLVVSYMDIKFCYNNNRNIRTISIRSFIKFQWKILRSSAVEIWAVGLDEFFEICYCYCYC